MPSLLGYLFKRTVSVLVLSEIQTSNQGVSHEKNDFDCGSGCSGSCCGGVVVDSGAGRRFESNRSRLRPGAWVSLLQPATSSCRSKYSVPPPAISFLTTYSTLAADSALAVPVRSRLPA